MTYFVPILRQTQWYQSFKTNRETPYPPLRDLRLKNGTKEGFQEKGRKGQNGFMASKRIEYLTPDRVTRRDAWTNFLLRYRVEIDQDALDQMARKAWKSKAMNSRDGAVKVTILECVDSANAGDSKP